MKNTCNNDNSVKQAFVAGIAGSKAMLINVTSLMWLNTVTNNQYCKGDTMSNTLKNLYRQGGIGRFYNGITPTLLHGCTSRFGDVYSHTMMKDISDNKNVFVDTIVSATMSSTFRAILTPVETWKVFKQVDGENSAQKFRKKITTYGPLSAWNGWGAVFASNFVGYVPWFYTYDTLDKCVPKQNIMSMDAKYDCHYNFCRNGLIGFTSSIVSDVFSNGIRVVKTLKQHDTRNPTYGQLIIDNMGRNGGIRFMFRGIETRLITNGIQSMCFTILWKWFENNNLDIKKI